MQDVETIFCRRFAGLAGTASVFAFLVVLSIGWVVGAAVGAKACDKDKAGESTSADESDSPAFEPTDAYDVHDVLGWRVLVNRRIKEEQAELCGETLTLLQQQLYLVTRVVPAEALGKLKQVTIWVEEAEPHHPCMAYHPDAAWLRDHDMNPDKGRCVELANARAFLDWTIQQPYMVLHELAHAYHDQFLGGFDNAEIRAAYDEAMKEKRYDEVLRYSGKRERAYAATNPMEYFAELSEAYLGTNDFYPFVRSELKEHDPRGYAALEELWGSREE